MDIFASPVLAAARLGLDAAFAQQQLTAHNIANANTLGYRSQHVSFESVLSDARESLSSGGEISSDVFRAGITAPEIIEVGPVNLDIEVASLSESALKYQAIVRALNRHFQILSDAIGVSK